MDDNPITLVTQQPDNSTTLLISNYPVPGLPQECMHKKLHDESFSNFSNSKNFAIIRLSEKIPEMNIHTWYLDI